MVMGASKVLFSGSGINASTVSWDMLINISISGTMGERQKVGLKNQRHQIHKQTIAEGKIKQDTINQQHKQPTPKTLPTAKAPESKSFLFKQSLPMGAPLMAPTPSTHASHVASCYMSAQSQPLKQMASPKKLKITPFQDVYYVDSPTPTGLLIFWCLTQQSDA